MILWKSSKISESLRFVWQATYHQLIMGNCQNNEIRRQTITNAQIEKDMVQQKREGKRILKLLLLGPGESGKSTILKQIQILHKEGWTKEELIKIKPLIRADIIGAMIDIVTAMKTLEIPLENQELECDINIVVLDEQRTWEANKRLFEDPIYKALKRLWADQGIQHCYLRSNEYQLSNSCKYFLDSLDGINSKDYIPTYEDVLRLRVFTTGVVQALFQIKSCDFQVFDVGGQRTERRKWIHFFDNVTCIIFVAAISEYDQMLREDENKNRLIETIELFDSIINNPCFMKTTIILFLNKIDLFAEKIKTCPITTTFSNYSGAQNYESCVEYLKTQFLNKNTNENRSITVHETSATDTTQVEKVIDSVVEAVMDTSKF